MKRLIHGAVLLALAAGFYVMAYGARLPWQKPGQETSGGGAEKEGWCVEHNMPDAECYICNPSLVRAPSSIDIETSGAASDKGPDGEPVCNSDRIKVRIPATIAQAAGIETAPVVKRPITHRIACTAEIAHDPNRTARVNPRVGGVVREILKSVGDDVEAGEAILVLDSVELGEAKSTLRTSSALLALRESAFEREKALFEKKITTAKDFTEAQTALEESRIDLAKAEQRLRNLGFSDPDLSRVTVEKDSASSLRVVSPLAGTVVDRTVVLGEMVEPSRTLFEIVDASRVWGLLDITEKDLPFVQKDQRVSFTTQGLAGMVFRGKVHSVGARVDDTTRTIKVRADLKNTDGLLRQGMFGSGQISVADEAEALVVPKEAVQWEGCHHIVFVSTTPGTYQVRKVTMGIAGKDFHEVKGGLIEGDRIVTTGSFLLKTEILKGTIGAGCTD